MVQKVGGLLSPHPLKSGGSSPTLSRHCIIIMSCCCGCPLGMGVLRVVIEEDQMNKLTWHMNKLTWHMNKLTWHMNRLTCTTQMTMEL